MRATGLLRSALGALLVVSAWSMPARADPPEESPKNAGARAVQKGDEGIALYAQGKWDEAFRAMNEAETLYHSPVFLLYQARSARNAGRMLQALAIFQRLSAEVIDHAAPEPWKHAQAVGRVELATLEQDIPSVVIVVKGASPATTITLDGAPVVAGQRIEIDPGQHLAIATDAAQRDEQTFVAAPGADQQRLVLTLAQPEPSSTVPSAPLGSRGPYLPGVVAAAVGGVALIAGAVVGGVASANATHATDHLPPKCEGNSCLPSTRRVVEARLSEPRTLATTADVLVIGGAALAAVGLTLWIIDPRGEPAVRADARGATIQLRF